MSEDSIVQDGDVECGEDSDETRDDRPEQELVAPDIDGPLREILCGFGLHAEEGAAHVDHLPGWEEREPGHADEGRGSGAEHGAAALVDGVVAADAQGAVAEAEEHDGEGGETEGGHPETVDHHVNHYFPGEDAGFEGLRRSLHDIWGGDLEAKTDEKGACLGDILTEEMKDEFLNIVEHTAALLDGVEDRCEVIVGQDNVGCVLGYIGSSLSHGNAHVGTLQRWRVVYPISSHGCEAAPAVQSVDHAYLRVWRASGNNQRKDREIVDIIVR